MAGEIVNRVAKSPLVTLDLEEFYPQGKRIGFDLKDWLYEGLILKESDFREKLKKHDWAQYQDAYVFVFCSTEAILPAWAYLLVATYLNQTAKKTIKGNLSDLDAFLFADYLNSMDLNPYKDKKLIIKGCSNLPIPENAFLLLMEKLLPIANSIMYGEACSTVPLYKKKKQ